MPAMCVKGTRYVWAVHLCVCVCVMEKRSRHMYSNGAPPLDTWSVSTNMREWWWLMLLMVLCRESTHVLGIVCSTHPECYYLCATVVVKMCTNGAGLCEESICSGMVYYARMNEREMFFIH